MPSLHYLNPPPNPFWDFVAGMEEHPLFAAYARPPHHAWGGDANTRPEQPRQAEPTQPAPATATAEQSKKAKGKQATVEDPPEVDPATVHPGKPEEEPPRGFPFRGRGPGPFEDGPDGPERCRRGRGPGCGRRSGFRAGGPPFMFGPPWARRGGSPPGPPGGFGHGPGPHPHPHHHGPGPHPHPHPHHHHHGPPPPPVGRPGSPPRHGRPQHGPRGFDLGQFLNNLGERLGVDLAGAAESIGANQYTAPQSNTEADFEPRADIFDTPAEYIIHLSLPGAKKEDVGVDWDGENSILRVSGVVYRPGADEQLLSQLVVDGRKRETGVFEKAIRLGTKRDPANINIGGITAKMTDGILVVKAPKVVKENKTRDVPISGSSNASPARDIEKEKNLIFDADEEMYDAAPSPAPAATTTKATKEKEAEAREDRSETVGGQQEELPRYEVEEHDDEEVGEPVHDESDWEKYGSDEEGEYVKIDVK